MSRRYQEHAVPERLRPFVESFWSLGPGDSMARYPVLPDGCMDIVYSPGTMDGLQVVGTMTQAQTFAVAGERFEFGVRFRPGMATSFVKTPPVELTDHSIPLSDVWGADGSRLTARVRSADSLEECIGLLEAGLRDPRDPGVVQHICAAIVRRRGQVRMDELAFDAGMSARQLRRKFLEQVGLSPKHFCRIIRFRDSASKLAAATRGDWTQVALECGYYDQAHFINEFRELSGLTPGEYSKIGR